MSAITAASVIFLPPLILALVALSLWKTGRGLAARGWERPGWWVFPAVVLASAGCVTWYIGVFSGGFDPEETCRERGVRYDNAYRTEHAREPSQWFPLRNKCHAGHDLVPAFVNPTLVAVAVLLPGCAAGAAAAHATVRKKHATQH
ncbi:hypothetical protein PJ985_03105 [Streptomyces sp. ACA25]|uniref:hypothetical protein n=1 Tax=Streptomyces sp. ACA25 TaxID=3022596 RepID=UPI0023070827|nr:hypothetical protein [Streptomyces sp. ACA25]MDB1086554.1 hypothetical protein [Streptomyces sp. ACA25]